MGHRQEGDEFWERVRVLIGDAYRPHSAATGVFLFREKLKRRGYREEHARRLDPQLLARAVPWAGFMHLNGREYLQLRTYGQPVQCFACLDEDFNIYLVMPVSGTKASVDESYTMVRISTERLAAAEAGREQLYDVFRAAEDGYVFRVKVAAESAERVACTKVPDDELPLKDEPLAPPCPSWWT